MTDIHDSSPDPLPGPAHRRDEDPDPTGVREILSGLPDPGPMPPDLVQRITASLAAEQAASDRHRSWHGARNGSADHVGLHSVGTASGGRRPSLARRLPMLALAASIAVLAGAAVLGLLALSGGLTGTVGLDAALQQSASDSAGGTGESGAGGGAQDDGADAFGSAELAPEEGSDESASTMAAGAPILATGAILTSETLVEHARALGDGTLGLGPDGEAERTMTSSAVGTVDGAASCLSGLLRIDPERARRLLDAVDFVRFDGVAAALIVTDDSGEDDSGEGGDTRPVRTAYLVPLDCRAEDAVPLHEPVRIDS